MSNNTTLNENEIKRVEKLEEMYTTKELLNWIKLYGHEIQIIANIIEKRCEEEGFAIDIIKK